MKKIEFISHNIVAETLRQVFFALLPALSLVILSSCGGGGGGGNTCDMVANPSGPAYFKVKNNMSNGLEWVFENGYPFGADMKPGECTNMGVAASQYLVKFQQCVISDAACTSTYGPVKTIMFTVSQGDTYSVTVDNAFFN